MRRYLAIGVAALCVAVPVPALAGTPAGDWVGTLHAPGRDYALGLRIQRTPQGYGGTYESLSLELRNMPLAPVTSADGLVLEKRFPRGRFVAHWNAGADRWGGAWQAEDGRVYPVSFSRGVIAPAPLVSRTDRIAIGVVLGLMLLEAVAIGWMLRIRWRRRVRAA